MKGPIETPVVGASIEKRSTVIGEPSLQIVNFSETISSANCLIPKITLSFFISGASALAITLVTL